MKSIKIYFLSSNQYKINEVKTILSSDQIEIIPTSHKIEEIQSPDMQKIVRTKALIAFKEIGRPVLVEQTGLLLKDLNGFPGGLTEIFWNSLKEDKFAEYFSKGEKRSGKTTAKTIFAYCDGLKIEYFEGEIHGEIVSTPRGKREFQWDCVFQPEGKTETFSEMGEEKNKISMRKIALEKLREYLMGEVC